MTSVVAVANRALLKLGASSITSLDDANKQSRAIKLCFDDALASELAQNRWAFAIKRASLPALVEAPAFGFDLQYELPADFLRLDLIESLPPSVGIDGPINSETVDFAIEGRRILTNAPAPLNIRYGALITDPNLWDSLFREVLVCRLAAEICEDITQSSGKRELLAWKEYQRALAQARKVSAVQRPPMPLADNSWLFARA